MDRRNLIVCNLLLLAVFAFGQKTWKNCSQVLCKEQYLQCTSMDDHCLCNDYNKAVCQSLNSKKFTIKYDDQQKSLEIFGEKDISFSTASILWKPIMENNVLRFVRLDIRNLCTGPPFEAENQLDFDTFPLKESVKSLHLGNNCLQNVKGVITGSFPNLTELEIVNNLLDQVPQFISTKDLRRLDLTHNVIGITSRYDFNNMSSLRELDMGMNRIQQLPQDLLYDLKNVITIHLNHNQITSIPDQFLKDSIWLQEFDITGNLLIDIPEKLFQTTTNIKLIYLSYNKLRSIPQNLLNGLLELEKLFLDHNNLVHIPPNFLIPTHNLDTLYLSNNDFTEIPTLEQHLFGDAGPARFELQGNNISTLHVPFTQKIPRSRALILDGNCIKKIEYNATLPSNLGIRHLSCVNCCLQRIESRMFVGAYDTLTISHNQIEHLDLPILHDFDQFESIDLSYNNIKTINMTSFFIAFHNNESVFDWKRTFDLSNNPFICDCKLIPFIQFVQLKNQLKIDYRFDFVVGETKCVAPLHMAGKRLMDLNENDLLCDYDICPQGCTCRSKDTDNFSSVSVDCSFANLKELPNFTFNQNVNLYLKLDHNQITSLPAKNDSIWYHMITLDMSFNQLHSLVNLTVTEKLKTIYFDYNHLYQFEETISDLVVGGREVTLSNNPWQCSCQLVEMKKILLTSNNIVDLSSMSCLTNNESYTFFDIDQFCNSTTEERNLLFFILLPLVFVLLLLLAMVAIMWLKYKPEILYFLFSKGICLRFVTESHVDCDKLFDAFVSYNSADGEWVSKFLVPGLENGHPSYKLCLHDRDWLGGVLISDQIVRSVHCSRRTIIVLTENFLQSDWSRLEFDIAYQQALKDHIPRIIVVVPNDVPDLSNVSPEFKTFITMTTYIEAKKSFFWRKLRSSMPRTKQLGNNK